MIKPTILLPAFICTNLFNLVLGSFPLEQPCLRTCANEEITANILQKCVDHCMLLGHQCGNRLNGEPSASDTRLSCANGCEIAFYSSNVKECKADCGSNRYSNTCYWKHPIIESPFLKCGDECEEAHTDSCSDGCDVAASLQEYYQYIPEGNCEGYTDVPRFLFAGQSNMVRRSFRFRVYFNCV